MQVAVRMPEGQQLAEAKSERDVAVLVAAINSTVRRVNTMGTNAIRTPLSPVSAEDELRRFRERTGSRAAG